MFGWVVSLWKVRIFWTPLQAIEIIFRSYCVLISYLLTSNDIPKTYFRYFNIIYSISFMENGPSIDDFANNLMVFHSAVRTPFFQDIAACSKRLRVETNRTNQSSQKLMDSFPTCPVRVSRTRHPIGHGPTHGQRKVQASLPASSTQLLYWRYFELASSLTLPDPEHYAKSERKYQNISICQKKKCVR